MTADGMRRQHIAYDCSLGNSVTNLISDFVTVGGARAGDAMERWRARLAVAGDPGAQAEQAGGAEEGEEEEVGGGGAEAAPPASGEYEFVAEGERKGHGGALHACLLTWIMSTDIDHARAFARVSSQHYLLPPLAEAST